MGGAWAGAASVLGWIAIAMLGCADPPHPLESRCLEALAYRSPGYGEVETMERTPTEAGTAVSIRYLIEEPAEGPPHRYVVCEFAAGDRWALRQMIHEGQVLPEPELALVNSDLLLQDLTNSPERFEERKHLVPKPPPAVAEAEVPSAETVSEAARSPVPTSSESTATRSAPRLDAEPAHGIVVSKPGPVRLHAESSSDAIRPANSETPSVAPPAAPQPRQMVPRDQIPSPSSGGSD